MTKMNGKTSFVNVWNVVSFVFATFVGWSIGRLVARVKEPDYCCAKALVCVIVLCYLCVVVKKKIIVNVWAVVRGRNIQLQMHSDCICICGDGCECKRVLRSKPIAYFAFHDFIWIFASVALCYITSMWCYVCSTNHSSLNTENVQRDSVQCEKIYIYKIYRPIRISNHNKIKEWEPIPYCSKLMRNNFVERKNTERHTAKPMTEKEKINHTQIAICRTKCCLCHYDSFRMQQPNTAGISHSFLSFGRFVDV